MKSAATPSGQLLRTLDSAEASEALRGELKARAAQNMVDIEPGEPLTLYGISVEVGDDLTGAEVEAV